MNLLPIVLKTYTLKRENVTNLIELLSTAYTSQNWELIKEAVLLVAGEDFPLAEPQANQKTPNMEAIVAAVVEQMNKTNASAKPASKKKIEVETTVDELNEDEDDSRVVNVIIKNKQSNAGKQQGPVGFKNGFNPTIVSSDIIAKEKLINKKMSSKVIKESRGPAGTQIVKCDKCSTKFDFAQVYPMGKINKESQTICHKCQIQR